MLLSSARKRSLVNLTPLIDVVFILLIFFMLASNFIRWHSLEISVGEASEIEIDALALSIVSINKDTSYMLNKKPMPIEDIVTTLRSKVNSMPDHVVVIQPEYGASVQAMIDLLNLLKPIAGSNISIAKPVEEE